MLLTFSDCVERLRKAEKQQVTLEKEIILLNREDDGNNYFSIYYSGNDIMGIYPDNSFFVYIPSVLEKVVKVIKKYTGFNVLVESDENMRSIIFLEKNGKKIKYSQYMRFNSKGEAVESATRNFKEFR